MFNSRRFRRFGRWGSVGDDGRVDRRVVRGKVGGYRSAASQARMRAEQSELEGDLLGAQVWREKAEEWEKKAAKFAKLLDNPG